ncbi:Kinase-like protein [Mycena venus]|uniref:Kinase-like protein n=1 Tax=Mycena venus TaxID=2733690 RepID=A0A8H6YK17_9AGAR|nr:Kinase-like protein [Mycena venus]
MSLTSVVDAVLQINPVPGLSFAFTLFTFIVSTVNEVQASKTQLEALAAAIGQLLATLNSEFRAGKLSPASSAESLANLKRLLEDIHRFVEKEQGRGFLNSLFNQDSRIASIDGFYRRIAITVNAFQISALLNVQNMIQNDRKAKDQDADILHERFRALEQSHMELRRILDINQSNIISLMVSIQRKLDALEHVDKAEHKFLSHTLQYLTATSKTQVRVEDWMISSFEVEFFDEIGEGGFGNVYKGTWNHTEVAIKVVRNAQGVTPDLSMLRKEIDIWSTLRHPNVLQFFGANTLDARPFIVMPYVPENARQFLNRRPDFDPIYLLRDVSLGLEYLHSRKICHGDLKGTNILVDGSTRALLCDFGLARIKADTTARSASKETYPASGSRNWMAPELLTGSTPRVASDVYAFGMTLYELYTNEIPLVMVAYGDYIELVVRSGIRPQRPDPHECPRLKDPLWELAQSCWAGDAKARPTATNLHHTISRMISGSPAQSPSQSVDSRVVDSKDRCPPVTRSISDPGPAANQKPVSHRQGTTNSWIHSDEELRQKKELQVATLQKRQRILGNMDPETLQAMHELAWTYYQLGRLEAAEELQTEVLERRKRVLGVDHPDTLTSMHTLTFTLRRLERLNEALALGITVVEKRKQILGKEHPNTLGAMQNLALTYYDVRKLSEAADLQQSVLDSQKRVLGREHPDTLTTMHNLAATYFDLGRFRDAEKILLQTMEQRKRVLGKDHPGTLVTTEKLIETYEKQGRPTRAKTLRAATDVISKERRGRKESPI